ATQRITSNLAVATTPSPEQNGWGRCFDRTCIMAGWTKSSGGRSEYVQEIWSQQTCALRAGCYRYQPQGASQLRSQGYRRGRYCADGHRSEVPTRWSRIYC